MASLVAAFAEAKEPGLATIRATGGDSGNARTSGGVDSCLVVPTTLTRWIQERRGAACYSLWDLVHSMLAGDRGSVAVRGEAA